MKVSLQPNLGVVTTTWPCITIVAILWPLCILSRYWDPGSPILLGVQVALGSTSDLAWGWGVAVSHRSIGVSEGMSITEIFIVIIFFWKASWGHIWWLLSNVYTWWIIHKRGYPHRETWVIFCDFWDTIATSYTWLYVRRGHPGIFEGPDNNKKNHVPRLSNSLPARRDW